MITYVALYMILYLVGTFFVVFTVRKERELNRMRRDLIANVSHELKTPIASIRAIAEVLHDGMVTELSMQHTYYGRIMTESERLEKLVLDILELSRLQSNRAQFNKVPTHADGIIPPIIDRYMMLCGDLGINLDVSGLKLENIPTLYTDEEKLITMMCTLMDNAVKFTATGGSIWVSNQINSKAVTFCIRDNGPGIRPEDMDRIFERFYKADVAHNSLGSGLGLAIAYEIARGLKEKLWVESTYGAGTSFFFTVGFKL
jgi:two-component system sensor histidine kinase ResE